MLVTTSYDPQEATRSYAGRLALELEWPLIQRARLSIAQLKETYNASRLLIVTNKELKYFEGEHPAFFFHPSLATIRFKRLINGESDTLIACSNAMPGDAVLDCTAGMGSDAIVFSHIVGSSGRVTALESKQIPYLLVREGLKSYDSGIVFLNEAMRRIEVKQVEHLAFLQQQPDKSADIVYFDPMFRQPLERSSALNPLRTLANVKPLHQAAITEAKRIARKTVIIKEHRDSEEFARLGFAHVVRTQSKIAYGVIKH